MLTLQEVFDKAVSGVLKQGMIARDPNMRRCRYRTRFGEQKLACAVGQLIPDELYDERIEDLRVGQSSYLAKALFAAGVDMSDNITVNMLRELQYAHDSSASVNAFVDTVRRVYAPRYGLDTSVCEHVAS